MNGKAGIVALLGVAVLCGGVLARPVGKRILRVCDDTVEPRSLDPTQEFDSKSDTVVQQIVEGLVHFKPDGMLEPALAERWSRVAPTRMTFWLRKGVRFHDGTAFDAQAVKFSVERYMDPATRFPGFPFVRTIQGVEIEAPDRVSILTRAPDGLLLSRLAGALRILPPAYYRKVGPEGFARHPIGTGPFRFVSREPGRCLVLAANRDYWAAGFPKLDGLEFHFLPLEQQLPALLEGRLDLITELPGTRTIDVVRHARTTVVKNPSFWTLYGTFDTSRPPLSDARVRRALNLAIDRQNLIHIEAMGNARPVASLSMPGEAGHEPDLQPYVFDPLQARRLLADAGYQGGLELTILAALTSARAAQVIAGQFAEIGVRAKVVKTTAPEMIADLARLKPHIFLCPCPDPLYHTYFIQWVACGSDSPFSLVRDAEFDRRLAEVVSTLDDASRDRLSRGLDRYIHDQALNLFTYQRIRTYGLARDVGFVPFTSEMHRFHLTAISGPEHPPPKPGGPAALHD
ncbi:MAG: ABC transporter substrate-binding protein [Candidatus Wallbacteria bacterium]|nr:ABC transporter substrate-binding protein [Candidatus Wallbacteria bacterium]